MRHFNEVQSLLAAYMKPEPYVLRRDENRETGLSFWITLMREPDPDIALAAGDCIHNLRSALDHIIYELSCHSQQQPIDGTAFPIFRDPANWDSKYRNGKPRISSGLYKLRAVPDAARKRIELLQPFQGYTPMYWQRDELLELHELDIADKHKNLNLAATRLPDISVGYGWDGPPLKVTHVHEGRLSERDEILLLRFDPSVDVQARTQLTTFFEVVFTDPPIEDREVEPTLRNLITAVHSVLTEITSYF